MRRSHRISKPSFGWSNASGMKLLIQSFREVYLQPLDEPLKGISRFLAALAGSSTFLFGTYLIFFYGVDSKIVPDTSSKITESINAAFSNIEPAFQLILAVLLAVVYALLVADVPLRHGPVRLYITGLLIPFISTVLIRTAWSF